MPARPTGTRGVALIIVLAFIALATVLVVAFMSNVLSSGVSEKAAASETSASQLAASAVQLVEGTITNSTEPAADTTVAWACQPGMIRTYGGGGTASASPLAYYKLYSSDSMIVTTTTSPSITNFSFANEVPQYWDKSPALYADLNAPLLTGTGGSSQPIFPIVDPRAQDLGVEGFSTSATNSNLDGLVPVTGAAVGTTTAADPTKFSADSTARLPMPVRWMYVLKDGTMTVPDGPVPPTSTKNLTATWGGQVTTSAVPTLANPIVGRVAFWTDDEDAKLNVNTAAEGTYADTPIANIGSNVMPGTTTPSSFVYPQLAAIGDVTLALNQGAQREYQRYPGHPATTCLSPVFGTVLNSLGTAGTTQFRATLVKTITDSIPRVSDYPVITGNSGVSSMGGTQDPGSVNTAPLVPDKDRLYASLDEYQFLAPTAAASSRSAQTFGSTSDMQKTEQNLVDTCRFFLTAHSKSPELNLFGLPRVAMWPTWDDSNATRRSDFDKEIIHCATIAAATSDPHRMAFTRKDPTSPTTDFNIARNQQVYGYLQTLMGRAVPGFGGNFSTKYGTTDTSQILTEIFDYIRCTNLADQSDGQLKADGTAADSYTPSTPAGSNNVNVAVGQVVPTKGTANNRGIGRIGTISELALVLVKVDDRAEYTVTPEGPNNRATNLTFSGDSSPTLPSTTIDPSKQTLLEWAILPKFFTPMAGYAGLGNDFRVQFAVKGLKIGGVSIPDKAVGTLADEYNTGRLPNNGRDSVIGGLMGCGFLLGGSQTPQTMIPTGLCVVNGTNAMNGSYNGGTVTISGDVDVTIYAPNGSAATGGTPVQTLHFEFPTGANPVPIPAVVYWDYDPMTKPNGRDATGTFRGVDLELQLLIKDGNL